jgi:hypothetical protein
MLTFINSSMGLVENNDLHVLNYTASSFVACWSFLQLLVLD